ncbi:MAG: SEC-C metal-binding domain-containing protein [Longimicrobiales bacterium]
MTGRNDACPCGSGRKYKHCCQARDLAALEEQGADNVLPFESRQLNEQVRAAATNAERWQVEAVPVPIAIDNERDARPVAVLVVADGYLLHSRLRSRLGGEAADVAAALELGIGAAARQVGAQPRAIELRHADVAESLRARLQARAVDVHVTESLPELQDAALSLSRHVAGEATWPPACAAHSWAAWELPHALVKDLFAAAASYWRAAPWKIVTNLQAPRVAIHRFAIPSFHVWTACVLGNGGEEFGLALYSDERDLLRMWSTDDHERALGRVRGRVVTLTFDSSTRVPRAVLDDVARARWVVADRSAYPMLITVNTPGGGISQSDAQDLISLLDSVPRYVAEHRLAFLREQRTGRPAERFVWRDARAEVAYEYDGLLSALRMIEAQDEDDGAAGGQRDGWDDAQLEDVDDVDDDQLSLHFEFEQALQDAVTELGADASTDELLRLLDERAGSRVENYNDQPQAYLGNLSPAQVHRLLEADWSNPEGPIRLRRDLPLAALEAAIVLHNARMLLALAQQHEGLLLTQQGNLRLAVVRELIELMRFARVERADYLEQKRVTEQDVWPLHRARVLCVLAGLLVRRKGRLQLTKMGRALLADVRAGELYALLFQTCFRKLNLGYYAWGERWGELQFQIAFTLRALAELAEDWETPLALMERAVLPYAREQAPEARWIDLPRLLFERRVLDVLVDFGLMERKQEGTGIERTSAFRRVPLYHDFLTFPH